MPNFTELKLDESLLKILEEVGYTKPTTIQQLVIPKVLAGLDVIACAKTGTGKTAAFMLPILQFLTQPAYRNTRGPQVLVLVPTRELAMQIAEEAKKFSKYLSRTKTVCIYGGVPYPVQKKALSGMYEILVATPGRLMDHMEQGRIDLSNIKLLVLDEADRMLDMGFVDAVEQIAQETPKDRQTLLFSATIDRKLLPFSQKMQKNPEHVASEEHQITESTIEQHLYYVDGISHKIQILEHLLENSDIKQGIIFTSTKSQAEELAHHLDDKGYSSDALHGDINQRQRTRVMGQLRTGKIQFLVATDVAARGIDIAELSHVINFDLPFQAEDFIHRVGRTGRAGNSGIAITFSTYKEEFRLVKINQLLGKPIIVKTIPGLEAKPQGQDRSRSRRRPQGGGRMDNAAKSGYGSNSFSKENRFSRNSSAPKRFDKQGSRR